MRAAVHFLHISKTGGTAIQHALTPELDKTRFKVSFHGHDVKLRDIPSGEKVFFFLRNPLTRFVSGFYSRQRQGLPRHFFRWRPDEAEAFAKFRIPNELAMALSSSQTDQRRAATEAMNHIAHLRRSLASTLESTQYVLERRSDILMIGFQETLSWDFNRLCRLLALQPLSLPNGDVEAHRSPASLDRHLSEVAIANLTAWYREDFQIERECRLLAAELEP